MMPCFDLLFEPSHAIQRMEQPAFQEPQRYILSGRLDKPGRSNDDAMWFGAKSMYDAAGFEEVARRKPNRSADLRLAVPAPASNTKTCTYCQTDIPIKATRCPHCTSELPAS